MQENSVKKILKILLPFFVLLLVVSKLVDEYERVGATVGNFYSVISPFVGGICIAYILNIFVSKLQSVFQKSKNNIVYKNARTLAIVSMYGVIIALLAILLSYIIPSMARSVQNFIENFSQYKANVLAFIEKYDVYNIATKYLNLDNVSLTMFFENISPSQVAQYLGKVVSFSASAGKLFIALISSVYFLMYAQNITAFLKKTFAAFFSKNVNTIILKYAAGINQNFYKFFQCLALDALFVGVLATVSLSIAGATYAPLLGPIIGVLNVIPYIGALSGGVLLVLLTLFTDGAQKALVCLIIILVIQTLDSNVFQPKFIGDSLKINPLLILISLTIFGSYFGITGMIIAVPVATSIKTMFEDFVEYKAKRKIF